jgi:hypothetical protein
MVTMKGINNIFGIGILTPAEKVTDFFMNAIVFFGLNESRYYNPNVKKAFRRKLTVNILSCYVKN